MHALVAFLACSPPPYTAADDSKAAADTGSGDTAAPDDTAPSIRITYPAEEAEVTACTMVLVEIKNFELQSYDDGPEDEDGHGHYHIYYSTTFTPCDDPYCLIDLSALPDDRYVLTARLAQNDHYALTDENGGYYESSVAINFTSGTCTASLAGLP